MRHSLGIGALATAALASGVATAAPITVGESTRLVTDVEFWARPILTSPNPEDPTFDIISYGDPIQGAFRIARHEADGVFLHRTSSFPTSANAVRYAGAPGAEFVASDRIVSVSGLSSDDSVTIGDGVRFRSNEPLKDWFEVSDRLTDTWPTTSDYRQLFVRVTTPLDIIHGTGLDQEFDLVNPNDNGGSGYGFFRTKVDGAIKFMKFVVDRLRLTSNHGVPGGGGCTP